LADVTLFAVVDQDTDPRWTDGAPKRTTRETRRKGSDETLSATS
jgi:hypothetical protein